MILETTKNCFFCNFYALLALFLSDIHTNECFCGGINMEPKTPIQGRRADNAVDCSTCPHTRLILGELFFFCLRYIPISLYPVPGFPLATSLTFNLVLFSSIRERGLENLGYTRAGRPGSIGKVSGMYHVPRCILFYISICFLAFSVWLSAIP